MFAVERLGSYITRGVNTVSGPFHPFGGAVDIVVVEQQDGTFKSSPWYVRFGKFQGVLKAKEKIVNIAVDGVEANFNMYLDHKGVAYFLREIDDADEVDSLLWPSSSGEDADTQYHDRRPLKSKSCNYETAQPNLVNEIVVNHGKILSRTSSRRSKIFGLVFGRKSMKGRSNDVDGNNADFVRTDSLERAEIAANLLDVRWSTNLGKESAPHFLDSDISKGLDDSEDNGTSMFENSCDTDNLSWTSFQKLERPVEETGVEMSCIGRSALGQSSDLEHSYEEDNMVSLEADVLKENGSNEAIICCDTFKNSRIGSDDIEAVDGSTELISESEIISSTGSNVDQVNDCANSNYVCEEVESKKLVSTLDPVCDSQGPEEEHFLFSDGEDFTVRESFVLDFEAESSPDKLEEVIQVSKMTSGNVDIPLKDKVSRKQVGRVVKSLPNLGSRINEHHPLYGHSLDSITKSSKWMLIRKDLSNCVKLARDEVQILSNSSEPSTKDAQALKNSLSTPEAGKIIESPSGRWGLWPFKRSRTIAVSQSTSRDFNAFESINRRMEEEKVTPIRVGNKKKIRTKIPTSEQLASLNLKEGRNIVTFTFSTAMLGEQQVDARIYLWRWDTRIVISDVDGTITKSDLLGQFMPLVGKDWSQTGVANLFSAIKENGYQMLFLSARAISQAYLTRQFLFNLKQDGKALPDGPVVISPDGLFPSLFREVIRRAPHEFKIACLEDIKALFPPDRKPFYAGFGNRDTDEFSYLKVGIPKGKIFIINPKGEVVVNRRVDSKSYTSLKDIVHDMFPPMTSSEQEDFNSWNFWKLPPPDIIC